MIGLVLKITGMSCHHCKMAVEQAAKAVPGVASASVDLNAGTLNVQGEGIDRAALAGAVEELGYRVEG
jgi:copper chaperone CopZ